MGLIADDVKKALPKYYRNADAPFQIRVDASYRAEILTPLVMARRSPNLLAFLSRTIAGLKPLQKIDESRRLLGSRIHPMTVYLRIEENAWAELIRSLGDLRRVVEGLTQSKDITEFENMPKKAKPALELLAKKPIQLIDYIRKLVEVEKAYLPLTDKQLEAQVRLLEKKSDEDLEGETQEVLSGVSAG